ncbi:MAG: oligosaccharide flippase family protein [Bacteroidota bacterium]
MSSYKKLFQQTLVYGLATVLPRMLSFLLVPLYTGVLANSGYGDFSIIFTYLVLFNIILSYGMETAFFRFYNKENKSDEVINTSTISLLITTVVFVVLSYFLVPYVAEIVHISVDLLQFMVSILALDALVVIPFAWLRARGKSIHYTVIKVINVAINLGLNVFFLVFLADLVQNFDGLKLIYKPDFEISYILISNVAASAFTFLALLPFYIRLKFNFNIQLWKSMMKYALPVLFAGLAFSVNEVFDRLLLDYLLPKDIARSKIGAYSACYKIAVFMTLFATAFRLGIEPFFFSHAKSQNPEKAYALITKYFVAFGSLILLSIMVFLDLFKVILISQESYWEAIEIVPFILYANLFLGIYHNLSVWYKVSDKTRFGAYISSFGALITLGINFWLIPHIGYLGSAIATFAAYGSMMLASYFIGKKHYPIPYATTKISAYLGVATLFSLISFFYFRENYIVGILMILIYIGGVYWVEREEINAIIKPKSV